VYELMDSLRRDGERCGYGHSEVLSACSRGSSASNLLDDTRRRLDDGSLSSNRARLSIVELLLMAASCILPRTHFTSPVSSRIWVFHI
jgi:hypothetical protein